MSSDLVSDIELLVCVERYGKCSGDLMDPRCILGKKKKAAEGAQSPQSLPNFKQSLPLHTTKLTFCDAVACF